jgi:hypothetical protein
MSAARLTPAIEASALLARAQALGGFGAVLRKGDPDRGSLVLSLLERGQPVLLLQRLLQASGDYGWEPRAAGDSHSHQQHLAHLSRNDPDLWLIELDIPSTERFIAEMT